MMANSTTVRSMLIPCRNLRWLAMFAMIAATWAQAVPGGSVAVARERLELVAGGGQHADGWPATDAKLDWPFGVDFDSSGNMIIVEMTGQRVRKVDANGRLTTIAGDGRKGAVGDGGPATKAQFNGIHNVAIGNDDAIYVSDTWNNRVRKIDPKSGVITAVAGTGKTGFSGDDGPATAAQFGGIYCASLNPGGTHIYVADLDNRRIRMIDLKSGTVVTVAGNGRRGVPNDGAIAIQAPLVDPRAVAVDSKGLIYLLERSGHALRVVNPKDGTIHTVVGTGQAGATGDDGEASKATLRGPKHLCCDADDNVIIADSDNHLIRKYLPKTGKIVRVAGTGKKGTAGLDGDPLEAEFNQPHGVYLHKDGSLYITDSFNHRILRVVKE